MNYLIKSMTGYGRGESQVEGYHILVELKSVNNRFLEVCVKMPRQIIFLEDPVKKQVQTALSRGRVDVFVSLEVTGEKKPILNVDNELALAYYNLLLQLAEITGIAPVIDLRTLATFNGVITQEKEEDLTVLTGPLQMAVHEALKSLMAMRIAEGGETADELKRQVSTILELRQKIAEFAPAVVTDYRDKLKIRITELMDSLEPDPQRIAQEVSFFADKADITEELIRLQSHCNQFVKALHSEDAVGRKLEFILQEMNREVNTIGSKANDLSISQLVIDAKSGIEKIREQIQNIE